MRNSSHIFILLTFLLFNVKFAHCQRNGDEMPCIRGVIEGVVQGVEDRIQKRVALMGKTEKFSKTPLNLRKHVQGKFIKLLNDEQYSDTMEKYRQAIENAKRKILQNSVENAKSVLKLLAELLGNIDELDNRIIALHRLIEEHKNTEKRLTDLRGTKKLHQIPEIGREIEEGQRFFRFESSLQNFPGNIHNILIEMCMEITKLPRNLAIEFVGKVTTNLIDFFFTKFLKIRDLFLKPKYVMVGCSFLDLGFQLDKSIGQLADDVSQQLLVKKLEKRIQLIATFAHLTAMGNEGIE